MSVNGTNTECLQPSNVKVSKDLVAAAGFNVETPIVNALIGNLTGTLPTSKNENGEALRCEVCDCFISSANILDFHEKGARHKRKLKAIEIISQLKADGNKEIQFGDSENPNYFRCEVCCVTANSAQQLEFHLLGSKHKKKAAKAGGESESNKTDEDLTPPLAKMKKKYENRDLCCDICQVVTNCQFSLNQHLSSKKHQLKANLLGKK